MERRSEPSHGEVDAQRPDDGVIRDQLRRLNDSKAFDASPRNRRFLEYIVEETLAGRAGQIKAFTIATAVFSRDHSFDPQADPIIRIEAGRLRRSLEHYYLTAGRNDPVRITVPKGSYVPAFQTSGADGESAGPAGDGITGEPADAGVVATKRRRLVGLLGGSAILALAMVATLVWGLVSWTSSQGPADSGDEPVAESARGPAIFVAPFDDDSPEPVANLSRGFTRSVITGLTRFQDLFVLGFATSVENERTAYSRDDLAALGADYLVTGAIRVERQQLVVTASLIDAGSGQFVWSDTFEAEFASAGILGATRDVADQIVRALAQRHGAIFSEKVKEIAGLPPESLESYQCVLQFDAHSFEMTSERFDEVRVCLERVVASEPTYARGHSSLALAYIEAYRYKLKDDAEAADLLDRALGLAERAVALAPGSVEGYLALHDAYWLKNEVDLSFEAGEKGLELNPNHVDLMALLGTRYCLVDNWSKGVPLVERALARSPTHSSIYRLPLALHHYVRGEYQEALHQARLINLPHVLHARIVLAISYARLGRGEEARAEVEAILAMDPSYGERVYADLRGRNLYPALIEAVVDGLRLAGLDVPAEAELAPTL